MRGLNTSLQNIKMSAGRLVLMMKKVGQNAKIGVQLTVLTIFKSDSALSSVVTHCLRKP